MEEMALDEARAAPTPIEPGEATVSAALHVTYAIEGAPDSTRWALRALRAREQGRRRRGGSR